MKKRIRKLGIFIAAPGTFTAKDLAAFKQELSRTAFERGYVAYRGKRGSIFEFLAAIVSGEMALVLLGDEERRAAIKELRALMDSRETLAARDAFRDIANALERAAQREEN